MECLLCFICICIKTHTHTYIYIIYFFFGGGATPKNHRIFSGGNGFKCFDFADQSIFVCYSQEVHCRIFFWCQVLAGWKWQRMGHFHLTNPLRLCMQLRGGHVESCEQKMLHPLSPAKLEGKVKNKILSF